MTTQIIRATTLDVDRELDRATDGLISTAFKIPKVVPLATLLDSYPDSWDGNNLSAGED